MLKRHRQPLEVMSEMNVTNLLDTAFILLITFMLVAPQLTHGIKIKIPEVENVPPLHANLEKTVLISIQKTREGETEEEIVMDKRRVTLDEVFTTLTERRLSQPDVSVVIEADNASGAGTLVRVVGAVTRAGVENIGFSAQPPPVNPLAR
jgi:biopolymer transport protein ExbD